MITHTYLICYMATRAYNFILLYLLVDVYSPVGRLGILWSLYGGISGTPCGFILGLSAGTQVAMSTPISMLFYLGQCAVCSLKYFSEFRKPCAFLLHWDSLQVRNGPCGSPFVVPLVLPCSEPLAPDMLHQLYWKYEIKV